MKKNILKNKIALFLLISLSLYACKGRKKANGPAVVNVDQTLLSHDTLAFIKAGQTDWKFFSSKADVHYSAGSNNMKINAHIRMLKDSVIWISAGLAGIEGARIMITRDSAVMMNKLERYYVIVHQDSISRITGIPIDVSQLQNLLIANPVFALELYQYIQGKQSEYFRIECEQSELKTDHHYLRKFMTIDSTVFSHNKGYKALAKYEQFSTIDNKNFPLKTTLVVEQSIYSSMTVEITHSDVDFTNTLSFPFTIPSKYKRKYE